MIRRARRALGLAGLLTLTAGCANVTTIRHPMIAGVVDPNEVVIRGWREEGEFRIPNRPLEDTASLIEVTPARVCVYLRRWSLAEVPRHALVASSVSMFGDDPTRRRGPSSVAPGARFEETHEGTRTVREPGTCLVQIGNTCTRWVKPPSTRQVPWDYRVETTEAVACFENDGLITEQTSRVGLEVERTGGAQRFEWQLTRSR